MPVYEIGPKDQKHGFKVIVKHSECQVIIHTKTAEQAKYAAFNMNRQYSGIQSLAIIGY